MDVYEVSEKVQIVKWYYSGNSLRSVQDLFIANYPNRPSPSLTTIRRIMKNFETYGRVSLRVHKKKDSDKMKERETMVLTSIQENPTISARALAKQLGICDKTVRKVLKKNGYQSCITNSGEDTTYEWNLTDERENEDADT